jgi:hypothetical protein
MLTQRPLGWHSSSLVRAFRPFPAITGKHNHGVTDQFYLNAALFCGSQADMAMMQDRGQGGFAW